MSGQRLCSRCGCSQAQGAATHVVVAALAIDDLDAAINAGLLACDGCPGCNEACKCLLAQARETRLRALAARERYRARDARLQRRVAERAAQRAAPSPPADTVPTRHAALPSAAAAALARAKAKAAERHRS